MTEPERRAHNAVLLQSCNCLIKGPEGKWYPAWHHSEDFYDRRGMKIKYAGEWRSATLREILDELDTDKRVVI